MLIIRTMGTSTTSSAKDFSRTSRSDSYPCPSASSRTLIPCACLARRPTWQLHLHHLSSPLALSQYISHTIFCCPATTLARSPLATIPPSVLALFRNRDMKSCACPLFPWHTTSRTRPAQTIIGTSASPAYCVQYVNQRALESTHPSSRYAPVSISQT